MEKALEKTTSPDDTLKQLFDLIDQSGSYMPFAIGRVGGLDKDHEDHKWLQSEMDRLDAEIKSLRSMFFSEAEIQKRRSGNMKNVSVRSPRRSKGGRPCKK